MYEASGGRWHQGKIKPLFFCLLQHCQQQIRSGSQSPNFQRHRVSSNLSPADSFLCGLLRLFSVWMEALRFGEEEEGESSSRLWPFKFKMTWPPFWTGWKHPTVQRLRNSFGRPLLLWNVAQRAEYSRDRSSFCGQGSSDRVRPVCSWFMKVFHYKTCGGGNREGPAARKETKWI